MNLLNICRTCMETINKEPVVISSNLFDFMEQILLNRVPRQHKEISLPESVCFKCYRLLMIFKRFYSKCQESEKQILNKFECLLKSQRRKHLVKRESKEISTVIKFDKIVQEQEDVMSPDRTLTPVTEAPYQQKDHNSQSKSLSETSSDEQLPNEVEPAKNAVLNDKILNATKKSELYKSLFPWDTDSKRRQHICKYCKKGYTSANYLRVHELIHTDSRPHVCNFCGRGFRQSSGLKTHMALHIGKPVQCELCGQKFSRKSELIFHNRVHRNEKPFVCEIPGCNARFRQRQLWSNHMAVHSGIKNHKCSDCEKNFFTRSTLLEHMRKVHKCFYYQCNMCEQNFKKSDQLRKHLKEAHQIQMFSVGHLRKSTLGDVPKKS